MDSTAEADCIVTVKLLETAESLSLIFFQQVAIHLAI